MHKTPSVLLVVGSLALSACAVRSDAPVTGVKAPEVLTTAFTTDDGFERAWWSRFEDPILDDLVANAFIANRDIHAAVARVTAARELAGAAELVLLPTGGAVAGAVRQHLSEAEAAGLQLPSRTGTFVHAGVQLAWEADVFGRLRGRARAAAADANAAVMDARAVQVATAAQVASAYFDWRGAERDGDLLAAMRDRTGELMARTATLVSAGRLTRLDLLRTQQIDDELAGEQAMAGHTAERARLRLATLTGQTGQAWRIADAPVQPLRVTMLPIGGAGEVLRRRPDVAAAELRVQAAAARAGAARADLFPRVDLVGSIGLVAGSVGQLAQASAGSWFIAPQVAWAFLDRPQLQRRMRAAGALTDAAFADYERTVLVALEEVRVAIDNYGASTDRLHAAERRGEAASGAASIVSIQYREGMVDSLSRTLAERDAIVGALTANRALMQQRQAVVAVYRALGGGWE
jgi:NodT family efflux transporter outer membrane factor (OMF) lipoprotein